MTTQTDWSSYFEVDIPHFHLHIGTPWEISGNHIFKLLAFHIYIVGNPVNLQTKGPSVWIGVSLLGFDLDCEVGL